MGRAEKRKAARQADRAEGIKLEELDYLRLATLRGKVHEAVTQGQVEIRQAEGLAEQRVRGAQKALNDALRKVAPKYKLNPSAQYTFDDKRCLLIPAKT